MLAIAFTTANSTLINGKSTLMKLIPQQSNKKNKIVRNLALVTLMATFAVPHLALAVISVTSGNTVTYDDNVSPSDNIDNDGTIFFTQNSTLGSHTLSNDTNSVATGAYVYFQDASTADMGTIVNNLNVGIIGTLDISGISAPTFAIGALDNDGGIFNIAGKAVTFGLSTDDPNTSHTIGGTINNAMGSSIIQNGLGSLNLVIGDFPGTTIVQNGMVNISGNTGDLVVASGKTASYVGNAASTRIITNNGGTVNIAGISSSALTARSLNNTGILNLGNENLVIGLSNDTNSNVSTLSGTVNATGVSSIT